MTILKYSSVKIRFPQKTICRMWNRSKELRPDQLEALQRKKRQIEKNIFILEHTLSIVEKLLNRDLTQRV